jgi:putative GTP pyrophosphokinase
VDVPSRNQVNKAGDTLRRSSVDPAAVSEKDLEEALLAAWLFRSAHEYPLIKANNGLRSVLRTEKAGALVTQRLKQWGTILSKLEREPKLELARMQDIGGCRAVLGSINELRAVQKRFEKNRSPDVRLKDYITEPKPSGYRGVHVIVKYPDKSGEKRTIEVQLRTRVMHEWAITVEKISGRDYDLKSGTGPPPLLNFMQAVSQAMATEELGKVVDSETRSMITSLRELATPYLHLRGPQQ